jgi:hypothetical protein
MIEVSVVDPPAVVPVAKLATPANAEASGANEGGGNEISVLLTPQGVSKSRPIWTIRPWTS